MMGIIIERRLPKTPSFWLSAVVSSLTPILTTASTVVPAASLDCIFLVIRRTCDSFILRFPFGPNATSHFWSGGTTSKSTYLSTRGWNHSRSSFLVNSRGEMGGSRRGISSMISTCMRRPAVRLNLVKFCSKASRASSDRWPLGSMIQEMPSHVPAGSIGIMHDPAPATSEEEHVGFAAAASAGHDLPWQMVVVVATALLSRCHGQRNLFIGVGGSAAPPSGCCFCHGQRADAPTRSSANTAQAPRRIRANLFI